MPTMKKSGAKQRVFAMESLKGNSEGIADMFPKVTRSKMARKEQVMLPVNRALTQKMSDINFILEQLRGIVGRDPETALKWSDKTRAVELMLKYYGALGGEDSKITQNILNINVKDASEAELLATLSALQGEKERLDNNTEHPSSAPRERA